MEELSKIAMAYYQASSDNLQKLARDFFVAMDNDGDDRIDQKEFLEFMRDEGYGQMTNPSFFKQLDLDGNGTLDFREVMTLYYIVKSGRPFCDCCKKFITSTYLTCVGCLEDPVGGRSFYLFLDCYTKQKCDHTHNDLSWFLDNYSLLQAMHKSKQNELKSPEARSSPYGTAPVPDKPPSYNNNQTWNPSLNMVQVPYRPPLVPNYQPWNQCAPTVPLQYVAPPAVHNYTSIHNHYSYHYPPPYPVQHQPATSNAIVGVPQRQQWKIALGALNDALYMGVVGSTLCSIL